MPKIMYMCIMLRCPVFAGIEACGKQYEPLAYHVQLYHTYRCTILLEILY